MMLRLGMMGCMVSVLCAQEPLLPQATSAASAKPGQFQIAGGENVSRGALALLSEEAKKEFCTVTGLADDWKIPIHVRLHAEAGDRAPAETMVKRLVELDGARCFIVDLQIGHGVDQPRFKRLVFELMIYELALQGRVDPDASPVVMPWLVDGLLEASDWKRGFSDRKPYRALFEAGGFFRLDDLLSATARDYEQFDGATRVAFRVSSGVLVMALLDQPEGIKQLQSLLRDIPLFEGEPHVILSRHFPSINFSQHGLEKLWSLQMANKGGLNTLTEVLGVSQTENALQEVLHLSFRTPEGLVERKPLSAWTDLKDLPREARWMAIRPADEALVRLSFRCFPSFRPVLAHYQALLVQMIEPPSASVDHEIRQLEATRRLMVERASKGGEYLDWFEITRAQSMSGAFEDYIRLKERLKQNPYPRDSSLSRYLDRMDEIFRR
jgi:hypothetical protein